jgi:hypothetical protein
MVPSGNTIYYLNLITATAHLISGVTILLIARGLDPSPESGSSMETISPYLPAVCFEAAREGGGRPEFNMQPESVVETRGYLTTLVVAFFYLSAGFQYAQSWEKDKYLTRVKSNDVNICRYVEYSLSASVMMVLIGMVVGVYDIFTHILVFTCTFLCMILGLVADFLRVMHGNMKEANRNQRSNTGLAQEETKKLIDGYPNPDSTHIEECIKHTELLMWGVHFLGWIAIMVPYLAVFMVAYFRTANRSWECLQDLGPEAPDIPWFVTPIILSQFLLFSVFGIVQTVQFYKSGKEHPEVEKIGIYTELAFILLSLIAKSVLGWLAATQIIFA